MKRRFPGFTIVELIIVISIIVVLSTITVIGVVMVQKQSRDNQRVADALAIKTAVIKYYDDNGVYPLPSGCTEGAGCNVSNLSSVLVPKYLPSIPADPLSPTVVSQYVRSGANTRFGILVNLESSNRCKTGVNISEGWWGSISTVPRCSF